MIKERAPKPCFSKTLLFLDLPFLVNNAELPFLLNMLLEIDDIGLI